MRKRGCPGVPDRFQSDEQMLMLGIDFLTAHRAEMHFGSEKYEYGSGVLSLRYVYGSRAYRDRFECELNASIEAGKHLLQRPERKVDVRSVLLQVLAEERHRPRLPELRR